MYLLDEHSEKNVLRQGDIVSNIQIIGALNILSIQYQVDHEGEKKSWSVVAPPKFSQCMILSHSCEIDPSNKVKLTSIILAPIRDINKATDKSKIKDLIDSNIIDDSTESSFLKYFYIEPNEKLEYRDGAIVDFSKCFSLRNKSYNYLVENKCLQLKEEIANKMAFKLSLYFYREEKSAI